jgi:hypothetical protein
MAIILLPIIIWAVIFVVDIISIMAISAGLSHSFGWGSFAATSVGFILGVIPGVGTILAVWGAIVAWGWSLWGAIGLFAWSTVAYILAVVIAGVKEALSRKEEQ